MTRTGKIARLPRDIRTQLNRRLQDGEPGTRLVAWLNALPEVQAALKTNFGGRAITEQNLSEWKQGGGYVDWLRQEEAREHVRQLAEHAEELEEAVGDAKLSDRLATVLAAQLAGLATRLLDEITDPAERWQRLREVLRELGRLRRGDQNAARLQMEQDRWERQKYCEDEADIERVKEQSRKRMMDLIHSKWNEPNLATLFGGGEKGLRMAELITRLRCDLPLDDLPKPSETKRPPNSTPTHDMNEPGGIQPNPSKSK